MPEKELDKIDLIISKILDNPLPDNELGLFINTGSKRIRSKLALMYLKSNLIEPDNDIYYIMSVGELLHNASLLHDDVIDNSKIRRNQTTIGEKYSSNISILCGDYVVSKAIELLLKINNNQIFNIFNKCVQDMTMAEIRQYFSRGAIPTKKEYLEICKGKTANLFSAILKSCALYSNLNTQKAEKLGELFGICYQIRNDFEANSAMSDKQNNIYTAKDIFGLENAKILSDNYKEELRVLIDTIPENIYKSNLEVLINEL